MVLLLCNHRVLLFLLTLYNYYMKINILSTVGTFLILFTIFSCNRFNADTNSTVVAKVHDSYLYENDLSRFNFPKGLAEKDSISALIRLVDGWATQQLLVHEAKKNMSEKQQQSYKKLVKEYELNLFTDAFKNGYVTKNLNPLITPQQIEDYYKKYKTNFASNQTLVKVRFIEYPTNYKNSTATKKAFSRFNEEDQEELTKVKASFKQSFFNENDNWISYDSLQTLIPSLNKLKRSKLLVKNTLIQHKSGNSKFYIKFDNILKVGSPSPLPYVEESIKQIILNKRKLALKKQLELEILEDAKKKKSYQIY